MLNLIPPLFYFFDFLMNSLWNGYAATGGIVYIFIYYYCYYSYYTGHMENFSLKNIIFFCSNKISRSSYIYYIYNYIIKKNRRKIKMLYYSIYVYIQYEILR